MNAIYFFRLPLVCSLAFTLAACNGSDNNTVVDATDNPDKIQQEQTLRKAMAALDQPYVTALFYSNMKPDPTLFVDAKTTLDTLDTQWQTFKSQHKDDYADSTWTSGFTSIDDDLGTASSHYASINSFPADLTTAHLALENVREILGNMRAAVGIDDYLMDLVTDVHHKMEPVSKAAAGYIASPGDTALVTLKNALSQSLPAFTSALKKLVTAYGDGKTIAALYDIPEDKSERLSKNLSNTDATAPGLLQIATKLGEALEKNDDTAIPTLASKIKGKFVSVFLGFGDFITPFKADVIGFQRRIIPVLYCTGNPPDAATSCGGSSGDIRLGALANVEAAKVAWNRFKAHYPQNDKTDVPRLLGWAQYLSVIDSKLATLSQTLNTATDITDAKGRGIHLLAEDIRDAYYELVARFEGKQTLMTRMDEYHSVFEKIVPKVMDGNASADDIQTIKAQMPALQSAFDALAKAATDADKTLWDVEQPKLEALLAPQRQNIDGLSTALAAYDKKTNDNSAQIVSRTKALKALYQPFFKALGAFAS